MELQFRLLPILILIPFAAITLTKLSRFYELATSPRRAAMNNASILIFGFPDDPDSSFVKTFSDDSGYPCVTVESRNLISVRIAQTDELVILVDSRDTPIRVHYHKYASSTARAVHDEFRLRGLFVDMKEHRADLPPSGPDLTPSNQ